MAHHLTTAQTRHTHREVLRLALPAFLTLVVEPLFLLADTAIVGHLSTQSLAGLGIASAVLLTTAGIFVFLAYGTTAVVARQLGAGSRIGAIGAGLDGAWLAIALGVLSALVVGGAARPLCQLFGASDAALAEAVTYLRISALGLPGMLVILAVTGVLRGLQDTRTPLVASVCGFTGNIVLNVALVYGAGLGIAGSAVGTVIAQTSMALALAAVLIRYAVRAHLSLRPHPGRVLRAATHGIPLLVRTLALRAVLVTTTWVASGLGDLPLASHQVAMTVWSFLAFALDAIAIAAQALTGRALGAGDRAGVRAATNVMIRWGVWLGTGLAVLVLAAHSVLPALFTPDPAVRAAVGSALVIVALGQPLCGFVFVVDGVLIGADDGRWLAVAASVTYVLYLPLILAVQQWGPRAQVWGGSLTLLWLAFTGFMVIRAIGLWLRVRTDTWQVTGAGPDRSTS